MSEHTDRHADTHTNTVIAVLTTVPAVLEAKWLCVTGDDIRKSPIFHILRATNQPLASIKMNWLSFVKCDHCRRNLSQCREVYGNKIKAPKSSHEKTAISSTDSKGARYGSFAVLAPKFEMVSFARQSLEVTKHLLLGRTSHSVDQLLCHSYTTCTTISTGKHQIYVWHVSVNRSKHFSAQVRPIGLAKFTITP